MGIGLRRAPASSPCGVSARRALRSGCIAVSRLLCFGASAGKSEFGLCIATCFLSFIRMQTSALHLTFVLVAVLAILAQREKSGGGAQPRRRE